MANKTTALTAILALAIAFTISCSKDDDVSCTNCEGNNPSSSSSSRSSNNSVGKSSNSSSGAVTVPCKISDYRTLRMGNQNWMAENLKCNVSGSMSYGNLCYDNDPANCDKYGMLYNWETAMKACPSGWHLPSKEEWDELASYIESDKGCTNCDAMHLKARSGWSEGVNGLDSYGFSALPGGRYSGGLFDYVGDFGYWWSASQEYRYRDRAYLRYMSYDHNDAYWSNNDLVYLCSVRCVQD